MKKTSLVIMAAGLGSRFGGGIKQLTPMGPSGELIIDYSIHDALEAGFDRIVFIIRKDIEKDFHEMIGDRISKVAPIAYAYQDVNDLPTPYKNPAERSKPWGTGHAILAARDIVKEPFAVINADDYYGKEGFKILHDYLVKTEDTPDKLNIALASFILGNTLSEIGSVKRGICTLDENGFLVGIKETEGLVKTADGAGIETENGIVSVDANGPVSMNMWGFMPSFMDELKKGFPEFLAEHGEELKSEYLLPEVVDQLIKTGRADVSVLASHDKWFGVTYKEDTPSVQAAFADMIKKGIYKTPLF
jgi:hypothetical protein